MELGRLILICASIFIGVHLIEAEMTTFSSTTEDETTVDPLTTDYQTTMEPEINECTTFRLEVRENCDDDATCTDTEDSFTCACNAGYTGNGTEGNCLNNDECMLGTDSCDDNATCTDTPGSYTCACDAGYEGDGMTCTDIDECFTKSDNCTENEKCINNAGGFTCECRINFLEIDGVCSASLSLNLVVVFSQILGTSSVDNLAAVNTNANGIELADDVFSLLNMTSSVGPDLLGVSVTAMTNVTNGTSVTFLLDLVADTTLTEAEVVQGFLDGLTGMANDTVDPDSVVASGYTPTVTVPDIDPCAEGTDDCYALNYAQCVFESSGVFGCLTCLSGYAAPSVVGEACTEIFPCDNSTVSQACEDLGFVDCVHDGPGESHCANCLPGWTMTGDQCEKMLKFQGSVTLEEYESATAVFTDDLNNSSSAAYMTLEDDIRTFLQAATSASSCEILGFSNGSIIVEYVLLFPETSNTTASDLSSAITTADITTMHLSLVPGSVSVVDISAFCEFSTCLNGATCSVESNQVVCTCATGYEGSDCGTAIPVTTPYAVTSAPDGLSIGAIVGIVVGSVVALIIIVVIIAVVIVKCGGKSKVGIRDHEQDAIPLNE